MVEGAFTRASGFHGFTRLMSARSTPDAIFAANDTMAVAAYEAARAMGIAIPDGVAVVGFDDIPVGPLLDPPRTTVHVPLDEFGARAFRRLQDLVLDGGRAARGGERVSTGLVVRASCGADPGR